jgi:hypothetical protein
MMLRLLILAALATFVVGCGSTGSAEAAGDTKSLAAEVPPPKGGDAPHFEAGGHSIMKGDTPDKQQSPIGADVKGTPTKK